MPENRMAKPAANKHLARSLLYQWLPATTVLQVNRKVMISGKHVAFLSGL